MLGFPTRRRLASVAAAAIATGLLVGPGGSGGGPSSAAAHPLHAAPASLDGGYAANGRLSDDALRPVGGVHLAPDAAEAFGRMLAHARRDGVVIAVTDGYRSYEQQVDLKRRKGWLAARPGTSMHGWGLAIDLDLRVTDVAWMRRHAATYGWIHPAWAQPGGSKPEPWHWEFVGDRQHARSDPSPPPRWEPGAHVARVRLEPAGASPARWFAVREGLEGLEGGVGHYPGTAGPGDIGNFAIAGYHQRPGAPMRGLDRLEPGDGIRVRTADGAEHLYLVVQRDVLSDDDGWAVGSEPLDGGADRLMTLTTGAADGRLLVVWARAASPT